MKNIILLAPPAAGKGTQAELLSKHFDIPQISVGALLRQEALKDTEEGLIIREQQKQGTLVDEKIVVAVLEKRLLDADCQKGFILDGYPRSIGQAKEYEKIINTNNWPMGKVILLDVDYETTKKRIVGRVSCPKCQHVYNTMFSALKPKIDGLCDECKIPLVTRSDDFEDAFKVRYQTYLTETAPLIDYYENKGNLYRIASLEKEETFEKIVSLIGEI